jgi:hypothetical protein
MRRQRVSQVDRGKWLSVSGFPSLPFCADRVILYGAVMEKKW